MIVVSHSCSNRFSRWKLSALLRPLLAPRANCARRASAISIEFTHATDVGSECRRRVLNYLSDHQGEISVTRASQELGISLQQVTESLSRLQSKGLIQRESRRSLNACAIAFRAREPLGPMKHFAAIAEQNRPCSKKNRKLP